MRLEKKKTNSCNKDQKENIYNQTRYTSMYIIQYMLFYYFPVQEKKLVGEW